MTTHTIDPSQVLELRQYTLHRGKRDTLVELFDRAFIEPQEALGMRVIGQFRDRDAEDRFVWLRGFPDLASRGRLLEAFYGGEVWKANRDAANATMVDSDDVLLLRPVDARAGLLLPDARADGAAVREDQGFLVVTVYLLRAPVDEELLGFFDTQIAPRVAEAGAPVLARYRTEYGKNEFRLPVREGEHAFVWITSFADDASFAAYGEELARSPAWGDARAALERYLVAPPQELRLAPTSRSLLRHVAPSGYTTSRTGDSHDFDFLAGAWTIASRRLATRGKRASDWEEFSGTLRAALYLGGIANVDELTFPSKGWMGMTVRTFDLAKKQWTLRWVSSLTGVMDPGVVGGFVGDRGEFYGEDVDAGRVVKVRYAWTRLGADAARWEQAFSYDDGPWETNWVMTFTRARG